MYVARFSYTFAPIHRKRALEFLREEKAAAEKMGLTARVLVPLTRGRDGAALQFEVELDELNQFDDFRHKKKSEAAIEGLDDILLTPPMIKLFHLASDDA